jgi:soluble lytic murein transglycosylase-like protein
MALAALLVWPRPAQADPLDRWSPQISEASARFGIPSEWIRLVMRAESGGRTHLGGRPIVSRAGAMGLMQLMPGTWSEVRALLGLGWDPHDPRDNILAGTFYLREMYDRFGYPGMFAAYNAGPGRYVRHLATGSALPGETRAYVLQVAGAGAAPVRPVSPPAAPLFALSARADDARQVGPAPETTGPQPLFVPLRTSQRRTSAGGGEAASGR